MISATKNIKDFKERKAKMNKKLMIMTVAVAAAFAAQAAKELVDGYTWEYTVSGGAATVTGVEPKSGSATMPSLLGGYPVLKIGSHAFEGVRMTIVIPDGVEEIGDHAFFVSNATIEVPGSVKKIGSWAFSNMTIRKWVLNANISIGDNIGNYVSFNDVIALGNVPNCCPVFAGSFRCKRQYAKAWIAKCGYNVFSGYIDDAPEVEIKSAAMRDDDPTIMDVVYKVYSEKPTVKVRALAFADGTRSLAKVVRATEFVEGTSANIGDAIVANVEHTLSWRVSADWKTDLSKVKFEVLAVEDDLLPLELQTIPQTASHAAMKISWNKMTDEKVYDALLWLYADGDSGLTLTNGQLRNGNTILASGTGLNSAQVAVTYVLGKMGYGVLSGDNLTYARRVTQLDLPVSGVQQYAVKVIGQ